MCAGFCLLGEGEGGVAIPGRGGVTLLTIAFLVWAPTPDGPKGGEAPISTAVERGGPYIYHSRERRSLYLLQRPGLVCFGVAWPCLAWPGLAWFSLVLVLALVLGLDLEHH